MGPQRMTTQYKGYLTETVFNPETATFAERLVEWDRQEILSECIRNSSTDIDGKELLSRPDQVGRADEDDTWVDILKIGIC